MLASREENVVPSGQIGTKLQLIKREFWSEQRLKTALG